MSTTSSKILAGLLSALVALPVQAQQLPSVERRAKPQWEFNADTGKAELSFEETKKLVLLYNDYLYLHKTYTLRIQLVEELRLANTLQNTSYLELTRAFKLQGEAYRASQAQVDVLARERNRYKRWALNGDALPWGLLVGVVCFVGGAYVGTQLVGN